MVGVERRIGYLFVKVHDGVLLRTETNLFRMVDGVCAVLFVDAVQQVGGVILGGHLLLIDDVDAGLVEGHTAD